MTGPFPDEPHSEIPDEPELAIEWEYWLEETDIYPKDTGDYFDGP